MSTIAEKNISRPTASVDRPLSAEELRRMHAY